MFTNAQCCVQFLNKVEINNACIDFTDTGIINLNLNYKERIKEANSLKS